MPPQGDRATTSGASPIRPVTAIVGGGRHRPVDRLRLASRGVPVAVFERGEAGAGATWAAAGMLAGWSEVEPRRGRAGGRLLRRRSDVAGLCRALGDAKRRGMSRCAPEGTLSVAPDTRRSRRLRRTHALQEAWASRPTWLIGTMRSARAIYQFPASPARSWWRDDHQVDNRLLAAALEKQRFCCAGGALYEAAGDVAVRVRNRARASRPPARSIAPNIVVVAAAAGRADRPTSRRRDASGRPVRARCWRSHGPGRRRC